MKNSTLIGVLAVVIVPIAIFAVWTAYAQIIDFFNPCITWGVGNSGSVALNPAARGPCSMSSGGNSETILGAAITLVLIQGVILSGAFLGALGIIRSQPNLAIVGAMILFAESVPLMFDGLFVFTVLAGCFFLWASRGRRIQSRNASSPTIDSSTKH